MRQREEQEAKGDKRSDYPLLMDMNMNLGDKMGNYPLSGMPAPVPRQDSSSANDKSRISANDISAFHDDSVMEHKPPSHLDTSMNDVNRDASFLADEYDPDKKAHFPEERIDLLKDMRFI
jgi:hypothetical protein